MANTGPTGAPVEYFRVSEPGHAYDLVQSEGPELLQPLLFVEKVVDPEDPTKLVLKKQGTTTEAVIAVLIDRLRFLNAKMPSGYNDAALNHLQQALILLKKRTEDRLGRGVEGTNQQ